MNPFHDLGRRPGSPVPAESGPGLPSSGAALVDGGRTAANTELAVISLPLFGRLLALGVLGLAGLLSLGVGGVVFVQGYVARASNVAVSDLTDATRRDEASSSRANVRRESGVSSRVTAGKPSFDLRRTGARLPRSVALSGPLRLKSLELVLQEARTARGRIP